MFIADIGVRASGQRRKSAPGAPWKRPRVGDVAAHPPPRRRRGGCSTARRCFRSLRTPVGN